MQKPARTAAELPPSVKTNMPRAWRLKRLDDRHQDDGYDLTVRVLGFADCT
jgi:hypothetical protein